MGNVIGKKKHPIDERCTRPQREQSGVDYKKLRKLILSAKLAPCFPGAEDSSPDLEECPICFYFYPSLNRSRCCMKGICTECFLLMKSSVASRPAQCPFCKTSRYAVEYRGPKTQKEKRLEQAEEQKVIEAKIRMQCQEEQSVRSPSPCDRELSGSFRGFVRGAGDVRDMQGCGASLMGSTEVVGSPPNAYNNRDEGFDLDLEEIMMMEAICLSIQDSSSQKSVMHPSTGPSSTIGLEPVTHGSDQTASVTGGLALAIAKLAEQNFMLSESLHLVGDYDQTDQAQDENGIEESPSNILRATSLDASSLEEVGHEREASRQDCDGMGSENECVPSWSLVSENDVSEAPCASPMERDWGSVLGLPEAIDVESYCSSSIHSISDTSCGNSNCSEDSTSTVCSLLSGPITVDRQFMAMALPIAGSHA